VNFCQLNLECNLIKLWFAFRADKTTDSTSCAGGRHNMPSPLQIDLWPYDLESGVQVRCDV